MYRIPFFVLLICLSMFTQWDVSVSAAPASVSTFRELGIELRENIADTYYVGDSILIRGRVTDGRLYALIYLKNTTTGESISELAETNTTGEFQMPISLPQAEGEYTLIIASGNSFNTTIRYTIRLVANRSIAIPSVSVGIRPIFTATPSPYLSLGPDIWASMKIQQGTKINRTQGKILSLANLPLQYGVARFSLQGYRLASPSSLDRLTSTGVIWTGSIYIDRTRDMIGRDVVSLRVLRGVGTMQFRIPLGKQVNSRYYLTTPSGDVIEGQFAPQYIATGGYLKTGVTIRQSFSIAEPGVYKIEAVSANGYAYFNLPISRSPFYGLIDTVSDIDRSTLRPEGAVISTYMLTSINSLRKGLGRSMLSLDPTLQRLAQAKALDMAKYEYVRHDAQNGLYIGDFGKSFGIELLPPYGENVAGGSVSDIELQDGLEESGSHRHSMIAKQYEKVGIGYVLRNGRTYLVQIFGK